MSIVVTKRHSEEFPVGIQMNDGTIHVLTLSVALELRNYLTDAIEWAVNMDDIRREALARDRKLNPGIDARPAEQHAKEARNQQ